MADKPSPPPLREWKLEPFLPSTNTSYVSFQKPPNERNIRREGVIKEEFHIDEHCSTEENHLHTGIPQYQCVVGDHVPRYIPSEPYEPCKVLESHPSFQEEDISSYYTHKLPSMSKGSGYQSSSPSLSMPSLEHRWTANKHESDVRPESEAKTKSPSVATKLQILVPPTPGESDTALYQGAAQRSIPENNFGRRSSRQVVTSDANMNLLHDSRSPQPLEDETIDTKLTKSISELSVATLYEPNQPDSTHNTETLENYPPSDTESDSEGEWLTGRYIPGFLRDQWLDGSALEIPTTEACALAVVREALMDQIMMKFPVFNPKWTATLISNTGTGSNSSASNSTSKSNKLAGNNSTSPNHGRKRSLDDDDESPAGGKDGPPDPPRPNVFASQPREDGLQLACPFRKHDPERYNLREYRVCATRPWESISRLKQHLNTVHKAAVYCNKCKKMFETAEDLENHQNVPDFRTCRHKDLPPPAGVTPAMEAKLKGRWKASTPQALWRRIFQILFPNEKVPSPDFDQILEIPPVIGSPSRHEFRCLVRARLGELVDEGFKSLCERTISRLVDVVEDCYVQINLGYNKIGDAGHGESPISNRYDRQIDELSFQSCVRQQLDWDGIGSSSSPMWGGGWKGKEVDINTSVSPPQFSSTVPLELQDSSVDSSLSTCSATTSSDTELPKLDLQVDNMYLEQYVAYWNGAPTDMAIFDSYVEMDN